jgi:NDP-sugar pyrophosphorylase family protein
LKAGIIAAGLGERFRDAGIVTPKPLLVVAGKTLLERAVEAVVEGGAEEIALIVNAESPEVASYVRQRRWPVPVALTVKTTPSSMESFFELAPSLRESPFLLTTVDAIAARGALPALASSGVALGPCGTLAVTSYVDDEKPLWARLGVNDEILALGAAAADSGWVTSGAYFFHPSVYRHVAEARRRQLGRLRDFLALLLARGERLWAHRGGDSIDVDRPQDIAAAERFLETHA